MKKNNINKASNENSENVKITVKTGNEAGNETSNEMSSKTSNKAKNKIENKTSKKKDKRRVIVILFLIVMLCTLCITIRGRYLENYEIGQQYVSVFWQKFKYKSITLVTTFLVFFIAIYTTNKRIYKGLKDFFDDEKKPMPKLPNKSISLIISALVSLATSNITTQKLILFLNSTSFQIKDKIFGNDIGYYFFQKPFIEYILWFGIIALVALSAYMGIYFVIALNTQFDGVRSETLKKSRIVKQILNNAKVLSILIAVLTFFKTQDLSSAKFLTIGEKVNYSLYGAGLADISIKLWGYRLLSIIIVASVFTAISYYNKGKSKKVISSILTVPIYLCLLLVTLVGYNTIFINSNELDKQKDFINYNIESTRNAYKININEINEQNGGVLSNENIIYNANLLGNVSIVNKDLVLQNLNSTLTSKGHYAYTSSQIAKYSINNENKLVYISPREIVFKENSYINSTYEYTHGYGAVATSASSTTNTGNLENYQKDFNSEDIKITEPRIYFGLQTNETIVTNSTKIEEFDYPITDGKNATNEYDGEAGLKLSFFDRIVLAISQGDVKLAITSNVDSNSKILTNRNIIERAKKIMPYLTYDENPYLVVTNEGRLVWVLDGYTTSNYYPYAQKTTVNNKEINYIRNSVKVLIDAYDGTTQFYITDRTDPIIMAYYNAYDNLFMDLEAKIPEDISSHFVYPEFLYNVQADVLKRYHNVKADVLYRTDDVWDIAMYNTGTSASNSTMTPIKPYYTMLKTSNNDKSILGLVLPYTVSGRQNITSYLVGSYENGEPVLELHIFPDDSNVIGLIQLDTQIEQNEQIFKQIASLNVTGTKLTKQITVVPIDNKLLYIEAIYQQYINEEDSLPTLKKIVVASGNKVAIGDNLNQALVNLVSQNAIDIEIQNTDDINGLIELIIKANNNLEQSTNNGDWEMVGKDIVKLQELIEKLEVVYNEEKEANKDDNKDDDKGYNQNDNKVNNTDGTDTSTNNHQQHNTNNNNVNHNDMNNNNTNINKDKDNENNEYKSTGGRI